jgi:hypothetical protein
MAYTLANDNSFLDIKNAHLRVTGNVHATAMKIGAIEVVPGYSLERTANVGNTTTSTIQFTNPTTSLVTSGNVSVGGELTVTGNVAVDTNTLFVDSVNDRVGVGTVTPTTALDVVGTVTATAFTGAVTGAVTGNASTASALAASVNIGGVAFDGSAAIVLPGVDTTGTQNTSGSAATLTTARAIGGVSFNGSAAINLPGVDTTGTQNTSGSAATLTTARTIGGVSFNGSAAIDLPGVNSGGNQNTTGSAATLTTARTIGGVSFNGSAAIDLPGVNTAGNQNTTGSAATLTTARTIGGVSFNGSAAIVPTTFNGATFNGDVTVDSTTFHVDSTNNRVGIGTTSPGQPLDVQFTGDSGIRSKNTGSSHASVHIDSGSGYSYLRFESGGAAKFWLQSTPTGDLAFRPSGGGHVMDIKNNGNVGIGTSSPTSTLDVNGVLKVRGGLAYTNRPIAVVGRNAGKVSSPNVIITNVELYDPQNCHNTSNGRFTVPVGYAGYYLLMFNGIGGEYDISPNTRWTVNGNDISWGAAHVNLGTGFTFTGLYARLLMSCQHIHYLSESDYVNIRMIGGSTYGTDTTHCSVCIMYMGSN